jgi:hypothetical protein
MATLSKVVTMRHNASGKCGKTAANKCKPGVRAKYFKSRKLCACDRGLQEEFHLLHLVRPLMSLSRCCSREPPLQKMKLQNETLNSLQQSVVQFAGDSHPPEKSFVKARAHLPRYPAHSNQIEERDPRSNKANEQGSKLPGLPICRLDFKGDDVL